VEFIHPGPIYSIQGYKGLWLSSGLLSSGLLSSGQRRVMFVKDRAKAATVVQLNKGDVAYWDARYVAEQKKVG